jgi:hypothetical protein
MNKDDFKWKDLDSIYNDHSVVILPFWLKGGIAISVSNSSLQYKHW